MKSAISTHFLLWSIALFALSSCMRSTITSPDLAQTYNSAAMQHGPDRNPVILIPGILGSQLQASDGSILWGKELSAIVNPQSSDGLSKLAIPMQLGTPLQQLDDSTIASDSVPSLRLLPSAAFAEMKTYQNILGVLGIGGFYDESITLRKGIDYGKDHFTCFQFPYDWRRSCAENAAALSVFITQKKNYLQREYKKRYGIKNADIKFNLVSHSMGGLIARYYLRYGDQALGSSGSLPKLDWRGARSIDKAIFISTPHLGSVESLSTTLYGLKLLPIFKRFLYPAAALGTFPSMYEMMPRPYQGCITDERTGEAINLYSVNTWKSNKWGLLSKESSPILERLLPDASSIATREQIAEDHLQKCLNNAQRFHQALDRKTEAPAGLYIQLFIGDSQKTQSAAIWNPDTGIYKITRNTNGDGVVPRYSSLGNLNWHANKSSSKTRSSIPYQSSIFISEDHIGITKNKEFMNNMLFTLLQKD